MVMMMIKESKCVPRSFLRGRRRIERTYLRKHEVFLRQQNEAGTCYSYLLGGNMTPFGKKSHLFDTRQNNNWPTGETVAKITVPGTLPLAYKNGRYYEADFPSKGE